MALVVGIAKPVFNLDTGKFNITDATTGTPILAVGVFRITAPDGLLYYSAGNNAGTFAAPNTSTAADIVAAGGVSSLINIPLNAFSHPQIGLYKIDYNAYDGTATTGMTQSLVSYGFTAPVASTSFSLDCVSAKLTNSDTTNYVVDDVTPAIIRTHTLSKDNSLPAAYSFSGNQAILTLSSPALYAGLYSSTLSSVLTYTFTTYIAKVTVAAPAIKYDAECTKGVCAVFCGIKTLEMNLEDAKANGNVSQVNTLTERLQTVTSYLVLFNAAVKCGDIVSANSYLSDIETVGMFSDACCNDTPNYQILPYSDGGSISILDEGVSISTAAKSINFTGAGVTATDPLGDGNVVVNVPSQAGTDLTVSDEGTPILANVPLINFIGSGVTVTLNGDHVDVTIPGAPVDNPDVYTYNTTVGTTATNLAGAPIGTTFPVGTLTRDVLYKILNPYQAPSLNTLSSTLFAAYEVGQALPSGSQTVNYVVNNPGNIKVQPPGVGVPSTTIAGATFPTNPFTLAGSGSFNITIAAATTLSAPGSRTVTLTGTNTQNATFTNSGSLSWLYRVFYGDSANAILNAAQILALSSSVLASGFATSYTISGANYKYIVFPDAFGSPSSFKDAGSGFGVAMATTASDAFFSNTANGYNYGLVTVTNAYGIATSYRVYRTFNMIVGLTIAVS